MRPLFIAIALVLSQACGGALPVLAAPRDVYPSSPGKPPETGAVAPASVPSESRSLPLRVMPEGADPWIVWHEGHYYYTHTTGSDVTIWRSRTLGGLARAEKRVVWRPDAPGNAKDVWAPELHPYGGRWYVYVAATTADGDNSNHRMWVLRSAGSDPMGPYERARPLVDPSGQWAIDGTLFRYDGGLFLLWSGWEGRKASWRDPDQHLYVAPLASPTEFAGPRVELARPDRGWERTSFHGPRVLEAPQVLERDGRVFVVYSADQSWTDSYKLGILSFAGGDPLVASNWRKAPAPVFTSREDAGIFAPGHNTFLRFADGVWAHLYHVARSRGSGWDREVRAQAFSWRPDGFPDFGVPEHPAAKLANDGSQRDLNVTTTRSGPRAAPDTGYIDRVSESWLGR